VPEADLDVVALALPAVPARPDGSHYDLKAEDGAAIAVEIAVAAAADRAPGAHHVGRLMPDVHSISVIDPPEQVSARYGPYRQNHFA
jgi:hypothetical protein